MATTRRIGNLTIHFLGDNAEQLAGMFDDARDRSKTFRRDMDETSRTHKNIYIGSALADLQDQPEFGNAEFDPQSSEVKENPAFGKAAGAETHFIVVKPGSHSLLHDGRHFDGSAQLALVHELLHPSQITRELAESGQLGKNQDTEIRTRMREQRVAAELGMVPGEHFPDVIGSGEGYRVLPNPDPQPNSPPPNDPEHVAPIGYHDPAPVQPTRPDWRETDGAFEIPRYAAADAAAGLPNNLAPSLRPDSEDAANARDSKLVRYLSSRFAGKSVPSGLGAGATARCLGREL